MSRDTTISRPRKLSRVEKNDDTKRRLFAAATKIVGQHGYAEASVARITAEAKIGQGTFYNHFYNRQELLDQLLPALGRDLVDFIRGKVDREASEAEKEIQRYRAFFEFLRNVPEFLRILNEAELFAPAGYRAHMERIVAGYTRVLQADAKNSGSRYTADEIEVVVQILLGARSYLGRHYGHGGKGARQVPDHVISAYSKLISGGLFPEAAAEAPLKRSAKATVVPMPAAPKKPRASRKKA